MIKALSQKMDKKNFECFITNYETLIKLKENKTLWASAMSFVKNEVFTKNIFDDNISFEGFEEESIWR